MAPSLCTGPSLTTLLSSLLTGERSRRFDLIVLDLDVFVCSGGRYEVVKEKHDECCLSVWTVPTIVCLF